MKKHRDLEVTGLTALHAGQFGQHHETSLRDLGMRPVSGEEYQSIRKTAYAAWDGKVHDVPHSRIRAGQEVVSTQRAIDMAKNGRKAADPPTGHQLPSGDVMLTDGHHGVVADMLNGKTSSKIRVGTRYEA